MLVLLVCVLADMCMFICMPVCMHMYAERPQVSHGHYSSRAVPCVSLRQSLSLVSGALHLVRSVGMEPQESNHLHLPVFGFTIIIGHQM